mgnify:CR=1 FL=1
MKYLGMIMISILTSSVLILAAFNAPSEFLSIRQKLTPSYGTAFTDITGSTVVADYPTIQNTNNTLAANKTAANSFSALNQFTNASTSLFSCYGPCYFGGTATSSFSTAGALTLVTPLLVASGGTSSTTLSSNQILIGNGTSGVNTVAGWGSSGQSLVSNGGVLAPTWQSVSFDTTANYSNTGIWSFAGSATHIKNLNASSTVIIGGQTYVWPTNGQIASTTFLSTDGSGNLSFIYAPVSILLSDGTTYATSETSSTTVKTVVISAGSLGTNDVIKIRTHWRKTTVGADQATAANIAFGDGSATTTITETYDCPTTGCFQEATIFARNSASSQRAYGITYGSVTAHSATSSATTYNSANKLYISFQGKVVNATDAVGFEGILVERVRQ